MVYKMEHIKIENTWESYLITKVNNFEKSITILNSKQCALLSAYKLNINI